MLARSKGKQFVCEKRKRGEERYHITNNDTGTTASFKTVNEAYADLYHNLI